LWRVFDPQASPDMNLMCAGWNSHQNLLANSFNFTERGSVELKISPLSAYGPQMRTLKPGGSPSLLPDRHRLAFPRKKRRSSSNLFQHAIPGTSRKFGTGLWAFHQP